MLNEIVRQARNFDHFREQLRIKAPYFPYVHQEYYPEQNASFINTKVRILRDGKWYVVHCLRSYVIREGYVDVDYSSALQVLLLDVYNIIYLYKLTGQFEELDSLQIPEEERLRIINDVKNG